MFIRPIFLDAGKYIIVLAGLKKISIDLDILTAEYAAIDNLILQYHTTSEALAAFELIKKQICRSNE
jgi:hypothetical protein